MHIWRLLMEVFITRDWFIFVLYIQCQVMFVSRISIPL